MSGSDQRTEPVFEIDLRDLAEEETPPAAQSRAETVADELEDPNASVRFAVLERMAEHPESIPVVAVTARLKDPRTDVRLAAVRALEATGDEEALVLLLDAIQDPNDEVRHAVGDALRRHRSDDLLILIRRELRVPTRAEAADAALAMLGEARDGGPGMGGHVDPPPADVPVLLAMLTDPRPDRRRVACERLGYQRVREAVEPLLERLADPERGVRIKAADALAMIGDGGAGAELRQHAASDPDAGVALAMDRAARALAGAR